jgi:methionine sulfoxide reductase heme-binding subunit
VTLASTDTAASRPSGRSSIVRAPIRHAAVIAAGALLVWLFYAMRPAAMHEVHKWNRAWADAAIVLLAALFLIGPLARLWPTAARALEWRRELGIWAFVAAVVHVGYYAAEAFDWDVARFVMDSEHHGPDGAPVGDLSWRRDAWAAGNWIGIMALAYGLLPLLTSNNASQRLLRGSWKRLQDHGHIFYVLSLAHFFVFWLLVYDAEGRGLGPALFWIVFIGVAVLQTAGLVRQVARRT